MALLRLVHPFPSVLVTALTVALVPVADSGASAGLYAMLGLGMLFFQFSIGVTNDVVDVADDAKSKPWKPLARGALSRRAAVLLAAGFAGAGLAVTMPLSTGAWLIGVAGLCCGLAYDLRFKRTALSWLPFSVALPLIPAWVFTATGDWDALLWWAFPPGVLLGLALHLANQAPDVSGEAAYGAHGLPNMLGELRSRGLAVAPRRPP